MSLLMDALKKAELAKRQGRGEGTGDAVEGDGLSLEPIASRPARESTPTPAPPQAEHLPSLPTHLEELDAQFLADRVPPKVEQPSEQSPLPRQEAPMAPPPPRAAPVEARPPVSPAQALAPEQEAAQNLFAAKQPDKGAPRKSFAIAIGVTTALSVVAIGGYFWWQLQPKSGLAIMVSPPGPIPPPAPAPPATVAIAPAPPMAAPAPSPATDKDDDEPDEPPPPRNDRTATRATQAPPPEAEGPVRVSKMPLRVNPQLQKAFDAYGRGDLAAAQADYERVLKAEPRNTDALHGLAAIALRNGRNDQAEWFYQKVLEADPQDHIALAALINARGPADPVAAESRLKTLAAAQPDMAAPQFALGNLYARQGRWEEAQQAYFRAYTAEADNPDILYNLAISLEHLRQNKLAAQYYGLALAAAQTRPSGFDKAQATSRLRALQP